MLKYLEIICVHAFKMNQFCNSGENTTAFSPVVILYCNTADFPDEKQLYLFMQLSFSSKKILED